MCISNKSKGGILFISNAYSLDAFIKNYVSVLYMSKLKFYVILDNLICLGLMSNKNIMLI